MKSLPATALGRNGADYKRSYHHVKVDADVSLDDLLGPGFWVHYAQMLQVDDLIDIVSDVLDVQLRVVEKGVGFVKMRPRLLWAKDGIGSEASAPAEPLPELPAGYEIKRGPGGRFRVFQKDPMLDVGNGTFLTEREAILAARTHYPNANAIAA